MSNNRGFVIYGTFWRSIFLSGLTDIKNFWNSDAGEADDLLLLTEKSRLQERPLRSHVTKKGTNKRTVVLVSSDYPGRLVAADFTPPHFTGLSKFSTLSS